MNMSAAMIAQNATHLLVTVGPYLTLATTEAVKALGKKIGKKAATTLVEKGQNLWTKLTRKVEKEGTEREKAKITLFPDAPEEMQTMMKELIEKYATEDIAFAKEIAKIITEVRSDQATSSVFMDIVQKGGDKAIQVGSVSGGTVTITQSDKEE